MSSKKKNSAIENYINKIIYRCLRRGVDKSSLTTVDASGEITRAEEADANDKERIVDGVEDAVESNELRNC